QRSVSSLLFLTALGALSSCAMVMARSSGARPEDELSRGVSGHCTFARSHRGNCLRNTHFTFDRRLCQAVSRRPSSFVSRNDRFWHSAGLSARNIRCRILLQRFAAV